MAEVLRTVSRLVGHPRVAAALRPVLPEPLGKRLRRFHFRGEVRAALAASSAPPVLVYTSPKTASTAVTHALQAVAGQAAFQVHVISDEGIRAIREGMRRRGLSRIRRRLIGLDDLACVLEREVVRPRRPAKIVSLVREPVARNISFYFEVLDLLWQTERAHAAFGVERLVAEFHQKFTHERSIDWFDTEFKRVLGMDVYAHPFPREKGFQRITSGPYEVLLMRHDLEDRVKEECLSALVGGARVTLAPRNVGAEKPYAAAYREFLRRVELPAEYVEQMLGSKYARHFFGEEELRRARSKWLGPRAAVSRV